MSLCYRRYKVHVGANVNVACSRAGCWDAHMQMTSWQHTGMRVCLSCLCWSGSTMYFCISEGIDAYLWDIVICADDLRTGTESADQSVRLQTSC